MLSGDNSINHSMSRKKKGVLVIKRSCEHAARIKQQWQAKRTATKEVKLTKNLTNKTRQSGTYISPNLYTSYASQPTILFIRSRSKHRKEGSILSIIGSTVRRLNVGCWTPQTWYGTYLGTESHRTNSDRSNLQIYFCCSATDLFFFDGGSDRSRARAAKGEPMGLWTRQTN
jgi:hypothetical protein